MLSFIEHNSLLPFEQFGFRGNRSTCQQLLLTHDFITRGISSSSCVDVVYFDFRKAFDTVSHQRLISKLSSSGFRDKALHLLSSFVSNRF